MGSVASHLTGGKHFLFVMGVSCVVGSTGGGMGKFGGRYRKTLQRRTTHRVWERDNVEIRVDPEGFYFNISVKSLTRAIE